MGVRAVADDIMIRLPNTSIRTDTDIAHSAINALRWNIEVPDDKITVKVQDGWITLHGTAKWQFQRNAAASTVRYLTGVKGVSNLITVHQPKVAPEVVKEQIASALKRSATVDAARVAVESKPTHRRAARHGALMGRTGRRRAGGVGHAGCGARERRDSRRCLVPPVEG